MAVTITYFVHGTTTDNELHKATGWLPGELSSRGMEQAVELGRIVDVPFDVMISSDLKRAVDSAELGFSGRFPLLQDARLRECNYGSLNGGPEQVVKADMQLHISEQFPDGESYEDVERRMRDLLVDIAERYDGKHVAFMAHQAPQLALEVIVNGKTWQEAIETDWRKTKQWRPGWDYVVGEV